MRLSAQIEVKKNLFPFPDDCKCLSGWSENFQKLGQNLQELTNRVYIALALALDLDKEVFLKCHRRTLDEGNDSKLRSLYYPPIAG